MKYALRSIPSIAYDECRVVEKLHDDPDGSAWPCFMCYQPIRHAGELHRRRKYFCGPACEAVAYLKET